MRKPTSRVLEHLREATELETNTIEVIQELKVTLNNLKPHYSAEGVTLTCTNKEYEKLVNLKSKLNFI